MNTKICASCKIEMGLNPENFHRNASQPDGFRPECKACRRLERSSLRNRNLDIALAKERASHHRNRENRNASCRNRWANDPDFRAKWLEANRTWHAASPDRGYQRVMGWRLANPDKVKAQLKKAYRANPLRYTVSSLVQKSLRRAGSKKDRVNFEAILGYQIEELKRHLERQFSKDMTWGNYGTVWEVDHIQPLVLFKFCGPADPEFRAAWAITNMRPLGCAANRKKGGKRTLLL